MIPVFPELQRLLEDQLEVTGESEYVLPEQLRGQINPRTRFRKIIKRAGLSPWPKLWQNLRSTRQTELSETFPAHAVCQWIGIGEDVAKLHSLQITEEHFEKALQDRVQTLHELAKTCQR